MALDARDHVESLPPDARDRVRSKLRDVAAAPERHLQPLAAADLWAVRIGDYRVLVDWNREAGTLDVVAIGHRRNVYDRNL